MAISYRVTLGTSPVIIATGKGQFELEKSEGAIWIGGTDVAISNGFAFGTNTIHIKLGRDENLYGISNAVGGGVMSVLQFDV